MGEFMKVLLIQIDVSAYNNEELDNFQDNIIEMVGVEDILNIGVEDIDEEEYLNNDNKITH
jgi:hypothetical protein